MTLKSNFEETPTLLAPPSYLESTSDENNGSPTGKPLRQTNVAPHYIAWKLIITKLLGTAQLASFDDIDREEQQTDALMDVLCNVRLVSRLLYSVSTSILRRIYFREYLKAISATIYSTNLNEGLLDRPCRETRVLDHYISYRINRRHLAVRSSLLVLNDDLESDHRQVSQDLFKWLQPQTYIEDEIGKALSSPSQPSNGVKFQDLLVRFQFTRAAVTLPFVMNEVASRSSSLAPTVVRKECVAVERTSNEPIFVTAHRLLGQLNQLVFVRKIHLEKAWYEIVGRAG